jgi:tRNA pseudouridine32 synthase/23S rRNA pseudouridine746 synthase
MLQGLEVEPNPVLQQISLTPQPEILFEDDSFIIVCKPAEYLSVPGKIEAESVYDFIRKKYPDATGPLIVHRLDMSTSGLMVIAKNIESYHHLQQQFMDRKVKKRYIAILEGVVKEDEGIINLPLRVDLDNRPYQLVCYEYGKPAITKWKVIERQINTTRVEMSPITGRSHQLRVHSAHQLGLNCPIVGDDLYGTRANRLHLHAEYLEFRHPVTFQKMRFTVPAPF